MPTTTNNGWPTPADTDLVKNGADAIRDLGNAIDTTLGVYSPVTPGLVKINTTSFSGVSSQSFNNVFSATYKSYKIIVNVTSSVTGENLNIRLRASGTDNSSANYSVQRLTVTGTGTSSSRLNSQTSWIFAGYLDGVSAETNIIELTNPFETNTSNGYIICTIDSNSNSSMEFRITSFGTNVTTSYDGFTLIPISGTITGSVSVYGYNI